MSLTLDPRYVLVGSVLGGAAFAAQAAVAHIVARKLPVADRTFLSLAQHNGITSVILALILGVHFPEALLTITSAVIVINTLYYATNHAYETIIHRQKRNAHAA